MIWTSITRKFHHLSHVLLSYIGYESNLRLPLLILKSVVSFFIGLSLLSCV